MISTKEKIISENWSFSKKLFSKTGLISKNKSQISENSGSTSQNNILNTKVQQAENCENSNPKAEIDLQNTTYKSKNRFLETQDPEAAKFHKQK